jgi:hypothetical protein
MNDAIDSCKELRKKIDIPMKYAGTNKESRVMGNFNQSYDRIGTCFGNMLGSEFKKLLLIIIRKFTSSNAFELHDDDTTKAVETCLIHQILGRYFVLDCVSTATIEAVTFIKFVRDELLGLDLSYEKYIDIVTEIRNMRGKKNYKKLKPGWVNFHWIDKNRANTVLLFHHALMIQQENERKRPLLFPQFHIQAQFLHFDAYQLFAVAKEMGYQFRDKFHEIHLNRARSRNHDDYHVCFDVFMHFFSLANPAITPDQDRTEIKIFGEKDNDSRSWKFQFILETDGVSAHLLYKKCSKKKNAARIYKTTDLNAEEDILAVGNNQATISTNWREQLRELEMNGEYLCLYYFYSSNQILKSCF